MKAIYSRRGFSTSLGTCMVVALLRLAPANGSAGDLDAKTVDAELFEAFDLSKNGYLSGTEITPAVSKYDANGDGRVIFEEFTAGREKDRGGKPAVVVACGAVFVVRGTVRKLVF